MPDVERLARLLAAEMVRQNHMLEIVDDLEGGTPRIGVFDDYDNKFYDMRNLAVIALAMRPYPWDKTDA